MQFQYHQTSWKKRKIRGGADNTEHVQAVNQTGFLTIQINSQKSRTAKILAWLPFT